MSIKNELPDIHAWKSILLRVTAFFPVNENFRDLNLWSDVLDSPPEIISTPQGTAKTIKQSSYKSGEIIATNELIRTDWRWTIPEQNELNEEIPSLGLFPETLAEFKSLARRVLSSNQMPKVTRLAFGALLIQPVDTVNEAYNLLSKYTHIPLDANTSSDFLYQINKRRPSTTVNGLEINRLMKWSTLEMLRQLAARPGADFFKLPSLFGAQLEVDVNSSQYFTGIIEKEQYIPLFNELVDSAIEIAIGGIK